MALRYGGDVITTSTLSSGSGRRRASARPTVAAGAVECGPKGAARRTVSTADRKKLNGLIVGFESTRCGRLWDRSRAREAPACLAMMSREKAHQRAERIALFLTAAMRVDSAVSCLRLMSSNQYLRNALVSSSAPMGYAFRN